MKNESRKLFNLILISTLYVSANAFAFPQSFTDDENENADAISRFGNFDKAKPNAAKAANAKPTIAPISDASFEHDSNRAPASVTVVGPASRSPGSVRTLEPSKAPVKAISRKEKQIKAYQEVAVIANEDGFFPSTLFVTQGIPVRLFVTGAAKKSVCFMMDSFGVRRQIRNQKIEEITFTPDQGGNYAFSCPMNGAKGTVIVKDLDAATRIPASVSTSNSSDDEGQSALIPAEQTSSFETTESH